jgi:hypothetical protein
MSEPASNLVRAGKTRYLTSALNSIRTNTALRISLIVAMLLGWVVLSQRCVLGQMLRAAQTAAVQHECCMTNGPQPANAPADGSRSPECCRALTVLLPDAAKLPTVALTESLSFPLEWLLIVLPPRTPVCAVGFDTSPPPDRRGFVELVLHRSLRSHAPPVLA